MDHTTVPAGRLRTAASTVRSGHAKPSLCSLSGCRGSSHGAAKPLQMTSLLSVRMRVAMRELPQATAACTSRK